MRLSRKSEYAIRALLSMAREPVGRMHQIHELSRAEGIPVKFLEQILLTLRNGGLLASKRGVGGGYILQRVPKEITLGEIIELLDGPILPDFGVGDPLGKNHTSPSAAQAILSRFMVGVRTQWGTIFCEKTLADLLEMEVIPPTLAFDI